MNDKEKEEKAFKKIGDKIADVLNKHYVEKIVPEMEKQKIKKIEEQTTIAFNKMLSKHKNLEKYLKKKEDTNGSE